MSTLLERFWAKVVKSENGCWLWTGGETGRGYGKWEALGEKRAAATRGETMAAITARAVSRELSRYDRYEARKNELRMQDLTPAEYEQRLLQLADECGV